jgi:CheY-like chemotaxis protein
MTTLIDNDIIGAAAMTYPTVLLPANHRDIGTSLGRFGYEVLTVSDRAEALALLRANRGISVLVADVDAGGLTLAREARAIRSDLRVVYTASAPHRVPQSSKVSDAPILRSPYAGHQLAGVIAGLGRRVLNDPLAA